MMQAVVITPYGDANVLAVRSRPIPEPRPNEVRINVHAAGINRPDIFQRKGNYPAPQGVVQDIPGLEVSGVVESCGGEVVRWKQGDRVCALLAGGGYAEYVVVHESHCLPIPDGMDFLAAACLPETVFTVWHNVFERGGLKSGETLLVHGGSGGIGSTAIQLAKCAGATVYATAGSPAKCRFCEQLGAVACIDYRQQDFSEQLTGRPIDVILDSIGAPYFERNIAVLADEGRLVYINATGGRRLQLDALTLMQRRLTITGSTLRSRDDVFKSRLGASVERNVWPWIEAGLFSPVIHEVFPLSEAARAHEQLEAGNFMGKLALSISA